MIQPFVCLFVRIDPPACAGPRSPTAGLLVLAAAACLACSSVPNPAFKPAVEGRRDAAAESGSLLPPPETTPVDAQDAPEPDAAEDAASAPPVADAVAPEATALDAAADQAPEATTIPGDTAAEAPRDAFPAPDPSLANGLVARYRLDPVGGSTIPDVSGTRNGTAAGSIGWPDGFTQAQFPNAGALGFDGSSTYVQLPPSLLPQIRADRSISLWFWLTAPRNDERRTLLSVNNSTTAGVQLGLQRGIPTVWPWNSAENSILVRGPVASPSGWTHLVYTHRSGTHTLYVNGSLAGSDTFDYGMGILTTQVLLGAYEPNRGEEERWLGRIDDLRIYDRVLSATEVSALFAGLE